MRIVLSSLPLLPVTSMNKLLVHLQILSAPGGNVLCPLPLESLLALARASPDTASLHSLAQSSLAAPTYQGSASAFPVKAPIHCSHATEGWPLG